VEILEAPALNKPTLPTLNAANDEVQPSRRPRRKAFSLMPAMEEMKLFHAWRP
jgi:hypothetical protein